MVPDRKTTKAWKAKEARAAVAKAKAAKANAVPTPPKAKRLIKGHWSGYTGCGKDQVHVRKIAEAIERCCNTSTLATVKLLWGGWDNVVNIAEMAGVDTMKSSVANIRKPSGGSKGSMVSTMSKQKLQMFAFTV